jgi:starch phosphorylase
VALQGPPQGAPGGICAQEAEGAALLARAPKTEAEKSDAVLDSEALTIGFARRFATYKRATLILRSMPRLEKLLLDKERPIQLVFAGKAHPRDAAGKSS